MEVGDAGGLESGYFCALEVDILDILVTGKWCYVLCVAVGHQVSLWPGRGAGSLDTLPLLMPPDATSVARLLPIPDGPGPRHSHPSHFRPCPPGAAHHTALSYLAPVPALPALTPTA